MQYYLHEPPRGVLCWSLDPPGTADLGVRMLARGFQPGFRPNWMALDLQDMITDHDAPEGLEIIPDNTTDVSNVKDLPYRDIDIRAFSLQKDAAAGHMQRYLALLDDKIVAHSAVLLSAGAFGVGGLYNVGVVPSARNKGIGKAVVTAACLYAKEHGFRYVTLNGTGRRMYEQIGFYRVGNGWTWYLKTPRLVAHPPSANDVLLCEAIGRGDIAALDLTGKQLPADRLLLPVTNGMSLMELAIHCHQPASAEWLLKHGTPLRVLDAWDLGWTDKARQLLADHPERVNDLYTDFNMTLLHVAAERNDIELAKLALRYHPDLSIQDAVHRGTPVDWAMFFRRTEILRLLKG
jgi:GNAT superfamily N-acetyltransferase